jgi:charged multivesicular body protein 4
MDERMLKTGSVPVADLNRLPAAGNRERKHPPVEFPWDTANHAMLLVESKTKQAEEEDEEAELEKLRAEMAMG